MKPGARFLFRAAAAALLAAVLAAAAKPSWRLLRRSAACVRSRRDWARCRSDPMRPARSGRPAAWLRVPDCGISSLVLHGADRLNLFRSPCLTVLRGKDGMRLPVISAHRDMHFRKLSRLKTGSEILLEWPSGDVRRYRAVEIEIVPRETARRRLDELAAGAQERLVLLTCYPFRYIGPAPDRFLVLARDCTRYGGRGMIPECGPFTENRPRGSDDSRSAWPACCWPRAGCIGPARRRSRSRTAG